MQASKVNIPQMWLDDANAKYEICIQYIIRMKRETYGSRAHALGTW